MRLMITIMIIINITLLEQKLIILKQIFSILVGTETILSLSTSMITTITTKIISHSPYILSVTRMTTIQIVIMMNGLKIGTM